MQTDMLQFVSRQNQCCGLQVEEVMQVQRAEGVYREEFELDTSQINPQQLASMQTDQTDQPVQPQRKKPAWMKPAADTTPPTNPPAQRNSGGFQDYRYSGGSGDRAGVRSFGQPVMLRVHQEFTVWPRGLNVKLRQKPLLCQPVSLPWKAILAAECGC